MMLVEAGGDGSLCAVCRTSAAVLAKPDRSRRSVLRVCRRCAIDVAADRCPWCGGAVRRARAGRPAIYCGPVCRVEANRLLRRG